MKDAGNSVFSSYGQDVQSHLLDDAAEHSERNCLGFCWLTINRLAFCSVNNDAPFLVTAETLRCGLASSVFRLKRNSSLKSDNFPSVMNIFQFHHIISQKYFTKKQTNYRYIISYYIIYTFNKNCILFYSFSFE